ncbi:fumarylacetoacetate hydrolase domain-containing protein 2 [Zymoseptoria brevis]|uniref:Fumarylacetoacetate hydrolase domain-containing protein 2 n=1 Tax=Zymoseptoria brevis TaxID=1047168 RepID=A0A0F4GGI0_9PEZI|nr:fumarylacetoacetate hydrolase domain-containing protein 2 [Zymoseptoria brevis]
MSPVQWSRLVRYIDTNGNTGYGEPQVSAGSDILQLAQDGKLQVKVLKGDSALTATPTEEVQTVKALLSPLTPQEVPIVRCIGLNYKTHILETGRPLPTCPTLFFKPNTTIAGPDEAIPIPKVAQEQCDYEGEFTILIGKDAKNVSEESALEYVAGYTVGNDVSARDWQREAGKAGPIPQWGFSKSFDKYAPIGPCLVATSVLGEANNLALSTKVNGEERQSGNTADLCFGVKALVAFCSQGQTLPAGTMIMTGTPGGVGLFMKPPNFLKNGDEVVVEIEGIGRISNRMAFE